MEFDRFRYRRKQAAENTADPCKEIGCPGLCCISPHIAMTDFERSRCFPDATEVPHGTNLKKPDLPPGQYYMRTGIRTSGGFHEIVEYRAWRIPCPNKLKGGGCEIYNNRPEGCKGFKFAGQSCDETRAQEGFLPIRQLAQLAGD